MKKIICLCFSVVFCLTFISCTEREYGILFYQDNKITAECTVNDKYNIVITKDGANSSLQVVLPSEMQGVMFTYNGNECYAMLDEIKIPINKDDLKGIFALINIFSLDEGTITSAKIKGEQSITFENTYGTYTMSFDDKGYPKNAKITDGVYDFNVKITALKVEP